MVKILQVRPLSYFETYKIIQEWIHKFHISVEILLNAEHLETQELWNKQKRT